jgi:hypothetical protein
MTTFYAQALEEQQAMLDHLHTTTVNGRLVKLRDQHLYKGDTENVIPAVQSVANMLSTAAPFYWDSDLCDMLEAVAPTMPAWEVRPSRLPSDAGFIYFARPLSLPMPSRELWDSLPNAPKDRSTKLDCVAVGWDYSRGEVFLSTFLQTSVRKRGEVGLMYSADVGESLGSILQKLADMRRNTPADWLEPAIAEHDKVMAIRAELQVRYIAAAIHFLNQPLLCTRSKRPMDRAARKRAERAGWKYIPDIQVVELRKKQYIDAPRDTEGEQRQYEAHHRFFVGWASGGFWSTRYCNPTPEQCMDASCEKASDGPHKHVLVLPYMKRRDRTDLPILQPRARVYAVVK